MLFLLIFDLISQVIRVEYFCLFRIFRTLFSVQGMFSLVLYFPGISPSQLLSLFQLAIKFPGDFRFPGFGWNRFDEHCGRFAPQLFFLFRAFCLSLGCNYCACLHSAGAFCHNNLFLISFTARSALLNKRYLHCTIHTDLLSLKTCKQNL